MGTHDEEGNNQVSGSSEIKSCLTIICFYQLESFSKCLSGVSVPHVTESAIKPTCVTGMKYYRVNGPGFQLMFRYLMWATVTETSNNLNLSTLINRDAA